MRHFAFLLLFVPATLFSQIYKNPKASEDDRANDLLSRMTLEEKIDYIGGYKDFYIRGMPRFGLPEIKMTDGPVGTRNYGPTTAYPASILTSATWDTRLAYRFGEALGKDARERGVHILLAPGVNIYRSPMNGRNFEYLGEDPFLSGKMASNYIQGVQSQHVVATVKHFAANNQEWDRNNVSSDMDDRTLREIYLPAFKMAVQEGKAGAVMNSYNLVNGQHATQNGHLNNDILKGEWQFDGMLMSDWVATYDGVAAASGGLDLEMPSGAFMNRESLLPAIKSGKILESVIDDKVRRILRIIFRFGFYDNAYVASETKPNAENAQVALDLARNGIVLLKNDSAILPLKKSIKSIAVIGPNAKQCVAGGGSSYTTPFECVSLLDGITKYDKSISVKYFAGAVPPMEEYITQSPLFISADSKTKGLKAEYFLNQNLSGLPFLKRNEAEINHNWSDATKDEGIPADHFSARYTGTIRPEKTAVYKLAVRGDDGYNLFVDGKTVIDMWADHASTLKTVELSLEAGKTYDVKLEYYENAGDAQIEFAVYHEVIDFTEAEKSAASADVAIVSVGFDNNSEGEGFDRSFELPPYQEELINVVAKANPNTVVVLNAGGNVYMQNWLPHVKGLLHAWFPGQEGGTAVAEILFGKTNPSGKLPASFEKKWEDNPTYNNYHDPDGDKKVFYGEGLNIGYRYFDAAAVKPEFPFGFGLSYTTFAYSNLKITGSGTTFTVTFNIKNTGEIAGAESAQVYVHQNVSPVERPFKELKGFAKVFLKAGESKTVSVTLDANAFSYFKTEKNAFGYDAGKFNVLVGASSEDIRLEETIQVK
ncbi:glycoside hydrolase family 3 protein [Flavobacterium sp.]|uniref:beta-glucosidase n=1 Tax=Flavobacterium sp. TaxID=239 RepID=UPI0026310AA2|nr:glycoside hydrolase family 3 protein [Flavobacterium sp.]